MDITRVTLRNIKDVDGIRMLEASINDEGDLLISGYDLGDGVERMWGVREYEWEWTVTAANLPLLLNALGVTDYLLSALQQQFSDDNAGLLHSFLEDNNIPTQRWSRLGE